MKQKYDHRHTADGIQFNKSRRNKKRRACESYGWVYAVYVCIGRYSVLGDEWAQQDPNSIPWERTPC